MASAEAGDAEIPKALLKRLIKAKLSGLPGADPSRDYQINKDAILAFQEAAKTFIHYLTATSNDVCRSSKRQTISAEDVLVALNDIDFPELVPELQQALEEYRADAKERTKKKAEDKKRKAEELANEQLGAIDQVPTPSTVPEAIQAAPGNLGAIAPGAQDQQPLQPPQPSVQAAAGPTG